MPTIELTFYVTASELIRFNQILVDRATPLDPDCPPGTSIYFRSAEFTDGYEAHVAILSGKPTPYLDVVLYDDHGTPVAGEQVATDHLDQEFIFLPENGKKYVVKIQVK
jgi:hypothetical protein